jgi:hypothetical protein
MATISATDADQCAGAIIFSLTEEGLRPGEQISIFAIALGALVAELAETPEQREQMLRAISKCIRMVADRQAAEAVAENSRH